MMGRKRWSLPRVLVAPGILTIVLVSLDLVSVLCISHRGALGSGQSESGHRTVNTWGVNLRREQFSIKRWFMSVATSDIEYNMGDIQIIMICCINSAKLMGWDQELNELNWINTDQKEDWWIQNILFYSKLELKRTIITLFVIVLLEF